MEKKINIEELEKQCLEAEKAFQALQEQLSQAKKKVERAKLEKLAAEKDSRYKEVISAYEAFDKLRSKYVNDYGCFAFKSENSTNDSHSWFWNAIGLF